MTCIRFWQYIPPTWEFLDEAMQLAKSRLRLRGCKWRECGVVVDSEEKLVEHLRVAHVERARAEKGPMVSVFSLSQSRRHCARIVGLNAFFAFLLDSDRDHSASGMAVNIRCSRSSRTS